jgi:asparagine synthase (glutamine-hydrolysing)
MVNYLKEYADSLYTNQEFEAARKKYKHAMPFTKESLLYRELFERHYPGQAEMIAGFWMPNKAWEGCDVTDPSARVLSNYGGSGH